MNELIRMVDISKSYGTVEVLHGVNFDLKEGEVHALIGENGAGKSTLMKILGGIVDKNAGKIYFEGKEIQIKDVNDSSKIGVHFIHQELSLVPFMTVAENIFLGHMPGKMSFINDKEMYKKTSEILNVIGMQSINPRSLCCELSVAQQQMVEIARSLASDTRIIIMDEPTSSLTDKEIKMLFKFIESFREKGGSVIYISHRMNEIFEISDRITILRDGYYIGCQDTKGSVYEDIISKMVGREYKDIFPKSKFKKNIEALRVENLKSENLFSDISFTLHKGEILGVYGLIGSKRTEVAKAIFGLDSGSKGKIYIDGELKKIKNPRQAIQNGIALVPESRKDHGLVLDQSISFNATLSILNKIIKYFKNQKKYVSELLNIYIRKLDIKLASVDQPVKNLSGGNQQKVVLTKWLATNPNILILDEPTRGVDVGAKQEIYHQIVDLTKQGLAILFISSELPEIMGLSNNILVFHEGKIAGFLNEDSICENEIIKLAMGNKRN